MTVTDSLTSAAVSFRPLAGSFGGIPSGGSKPRPWKIACDLPAVRSESPERQEVRWSARPHGTGPEGPYLALAGHCHRVREEGIGPDHRAQYSWRSDKHQRCRDIAWRLPHLDRSNQAPVSDRGNGAKHDMVGLGKPYLGSRKYVLSVAIVHPDCGAVARVSRPLILDPVSAVPRGARTCGPELDRHLHDPEQRLL